MSYSNHEEYDGDNDGQEVQDFDEHNNEEQYVEDGYGEDYQEGYDHEHGGEDYAEGYDNEHGEGDYDEGYEGEEGEYRDGDYTGYHDGDEDLDYRERRADDSGYDDEDGEEGRELYNDDEGGGYADDDDYEIHNPHRESFYDEGLRDKDKAKPSRRLRLSSISSDRSDSDRQPKGRGRWNSYDSHDSGTSGGDKATPAHSSNKSPKANSGKGSSGKGKAAAAIEAADASTTVSHPVLSPLISTATAAPAAHASTPVHVPVSALVQPAATTVAAMTPVPPSGTKPGAGSVRKTVILPSAATFAAANSVSESHIGDLQKEKEKEREKEKEAGKSKKESKKEPVKMLSSASVTTTATATTTTTGSKSSKDFSVSSDDAPVKDKKAGAGSKKLLSQKKVAPDATESSTSEVRQPAATAAATASGASGAGNRGSFADGNHGKRSFLGDQKTNFFLNAVTISSGDRPCVYVGTADSSILVYDLYTGERLAALNGHSDRVLCVAVSNSSEVYFGDRPPALNPSGKHFIVSGSRDEFIWIWDAMTNIRLHSLHAHKGPVWAVAAVIRGEVGYAVSCSDEGSIRIWDAYSGAKLFNLKGQRGRVLSICILDKRAPSLELLSAGQDKAIHVWNLEEGKHKRLLEGHEHEVTDVITGNFKPSETNQLLSSGGYGNSSTSKKVVTLIISASRDKTIRVWDYEEGIILSVLVGHSAAVLTLSIGIMFAPFLKAKVGANTPVVLSGGEDGTMMIWSLDTGKPIKSVRGHANSIKGMATEIVHYGRNEKQMLVASCGWDKTLHFCELDHVLAEEDSMCGGCSCTIS